MSRRRTAPPYRGGTARGLSPQSDSHTCPRSGCTKQVSNIHFACPGHWYALPADVQRMIKKTATRSILDPERRNAVQAAYAAWGNE